jgi:HTH-type transcriptional regulator, sugar sensing transcriptional regulator
MQISKVLKNYGLNDKQVKVYLACLELGSASVQKISQKAGLVRTTVYEVLGSLQKKGFVNSFLKKKVQYYSAEEPSQVINFAQTKVNALKDALPEFNALVGAARNRPKIRFYQGKDEMKMVFQEILAEAKKLSAFASVNDFLREFKSYHYKHFLTKRIERKIPIRVILPESKLARERQKLGQKELRITKIAPPDYDFKGLTYIWKNKIAMFSFTSDFVVIVIESQELADMQLAMFNLLWDRI